MPPTQVTLKVRCSRCNGTLDTSLYIDDLAGGGIDVGSCPACERRIHRTLTKALQSIAWKAQRGAKGALAAGIACEEIAEIVKTALAKE
jgi:hypothetical protein